MKQSSRITFSIIFFMIGSTLLFCTDQVPLTFDTLFPNSWYKKAFDSCVQVWGDMRLLQEEGQNISLQDRTLLVDAAVGRLSYVCLCLERMDLANKDVTVGHDDIDYLITIVGRIKEASQKDLQGKGDDHMVGLQKMTDNIVLFLKNLFENIKC